MRRLTDPFDNQASRGHDANGNIAWQLDPKGQAVYFEFDANSRIVVTEDALGGVTYSHYDENGNRIMLLDSNVHPTYFEFNEIDRRSMVKDALGNERTFGYDASGNQTVGVDGRGLATYYTFDALNRRTAALYADDVSVYFEYDEVGNRTKMIDTWGTTTWVYDSRDRLSIRLQPGALHTYYQFDAVGNRTRLIDPKGNVVAYEYDASDRMMSATAGGGRSAYYEFDANGRMIQKLLSNGTISYHNYDAARRETAIQDVTSDLSSIMTLAFTLDTDGGAISALKEDGSCWYYEYDASYRLTKAEWRDSGGGRLYGYEYEYDKVGNRTAFVENDIPTYYTYDSANELLSESSAAETASYQYDGHGNTIARSVEGGDTTYFGYDSRNDLVAVWSRDDAFSPNYFNYDGDSVRIQTIDSTDETNYTWDGLNIILERDASDSQKHAYSHGFTAISGAFSLLEVTDEQNAHYAYHLDHVGGVRDLTDDSASIVKSYEYSPFGRIVEETGSAPARFAFPGTYSTVAAVQRLRLSPTRVYDAELGRFIARDLRLEASVAGDNLYDYGGSTPANTMDPSGQASLPKCPDWAKKKKKADGWWYRTKTQHPDNPPEYNGCGPEGFEDLVPDDWGAFSFEDACNGHDVCYSTCGSNRTACDDQFLMSMMAECFELPWYMPKETMQCILLAGIYYGVVAVGGGSWFEKAQDEHCRWERCCP